MRIAVGLVLLLAFSGISGAAQTHSSGAGSLLLRPEPPSRALILTCPIDMRVHQGMGGVMLAVDKDGVKRLMFAPRLRLFLNDQRPDKSGEKIVAATVTVRGSSGKARMMPLDAGSSGNEVQNAENLTRTINVDLGNWGEPGVSGDFRLPGFASASRIDLQSVTYEDGSTWSVASSDSCSVAPDPVMLISH